MAIVYRHIRLDKNEPFYIGIGKTERRATQKRGDRRNQYWRNIILKTEYDVEILFDDLTWEEACEKEIELIKLYGRKDLGTGTLVNMTDGGDGAVNRISTKKGIKLTEEVKEKMRLGNLGDKNPFYGKKHTEETKKRIENTFFVKGQIPHNKGKSHNDETKEKMRQAWIKRKQKQNNG